MEQLKERNLKVYNQSRNGYSNIPTILLKGHRLEQFGFNIDDKVILICNNDEIIIRKVNKDLIMFLFFCGISMVNFLLY